jgi:hypothetical protein
MTGEILPQLIREMVLKEFRGQADLLDVVMRLRVKTKDPKDPQVADIITNIRVIKGVAIVRQVSPVIRTKDGNDVLQVSVKFLPPTENTEKAVEVIGKLVRKLPGVDICMILSVGGKEIRRKNGDPFIW